jgi:hypothetical protein
MAATKKPQQGVVYKKVCVCKTAPMLRKAKTEHGLIEHRQQANIKP